MVTLHDIAEKAGVSTATVSRVLSGKDNISLRTRGKVLEIAKTLNYSNTPSLRDVATLAGVSMSTVSNVLNGRPAGNHSRVAVLRAAAELNYLTHAAAAPAQRSVIYATPDSPVDIINSINTTAIGLGYNVLYMPTAIYPDETYIHFLESGIASGIIFFNCSNFDLIRRCAARFPTVQCGSYTDVPGSRVVAIDYELAACELTTELLNVGKSRIWFLTGLNDDASQIRRYSTVYIAGMRRALRERGLPEANGEVLDLGKYGIVGDFDFHCRYVEKMLSMPPDKRPDALLCMNGTLAAAYINMLTIAGASIPDDVAVASFLGGRHDKQCNPYITSLLPPNDSLGREAMQVVADLIEGQRQRPLTMLFQHHIRFGGSTRKELCPFEMIDG